MKRIIYTQQDGSVAIVVPAPNYIAELVNSGMTLQEAFEYVGKKDCVVPVFGVDGNVDSYEELPHEIVDTNTIPTDRTFRNAWTRVHRDIVTDIPKAKLIAHDKRRAKRAAEMKDLDIEATIPAKAAQAEAARQVIRDKHATLQTAIDAATTEAGLKQLLIDAGALWPSQPI